MIRHPHTSRRNGWLPSKSDVFRGLLSALNSYQTQEEDMQLGNFSISLAVKDIEASKKFYEKLGFTAFGGDQSQNWLIMKNGDTNIGLFQGMFENNILTFNPGWNSNAQPRRRIYGRSRIAASTQSERCGDDVRG